MKKLFPLVMSALLSTFFFVVYAQEQTSQQPTKEELDKQKAEWRKNGYTLLDQVISEAALLKLSENRIRVQISSADLLWDHDQSRARALFSQAADGVIEMTRSFDQNPRQNVQRRPPQLRQDLVLTVARHDAPLAYQLLASTKPAATPQPTPDPRNPRATFNAEDALEQGLLSRVAALDPQLAAQNAEQMLEKGQFPRAITDVIANLQKQDVESANKLIDKTVRRIQSANILSNNDAATLALALLANGPRTETKTDNSATSTNSTAQRTSVLDQSTYTDVLSTVIDSALKAVVPQSNQRGPNQRARPQTAPTPGATPTPPTDAQIEQANSRRLLGGLQSLLPQIDQYLPVRAAAVRQKMTELGITDNRNNFGQIMNQLQQSNNATADALLQLAPTAPAQMQSRIYQEAAYRALSEGNADRARQIATDHLTASSRDSVLQRIAFRELAGRADNVGLDEIRQSLARLGSDNERIDLLLQMVTDFAATNPKLVRQLLDEARQITNRRATAYDQFEQQLRVAHAYASVDPARGFDVLDPGIAQLNELLSAASILNGFELNLFRDGEMPIQGGGAMSVTISRYGQELALLARSDFERAEALAGRFQFPEARILARLTIAQGLLGRATPPPQRTFTQNFRPGS